MKYRHWLTSFTTSSKTSSRRRYAGWSYSALTQSIQSATNLIEKLESRALLSVAQFNGTYSGAFSGQVVIDGTTENLPGPETVQDNSLEVTIKDGQVTVNIPGVDGSGTGTIDANGTFSVNATGTAEGGGIGASYTGVLQVTGNGVIGTGRWMITSADPGTGITSGGGSWALTQQTASNFDGTYTGSYSGSINVEGVGNNIPVPGPLVADNSLLVTIDGGFTTVDVPGIGGSGSTIIFPSGDNLSVDTEGSLSGSDVSVQYQGSLNDDGTGNVTGSGTWMIVNTPGVTGSGTWQITLNVRQDFTVNLPDEPGDTFNEYTLFTDENGNLVIFQRDPDTDNFTIEVFQQPEESIGQLTINGTARDDRFILDIDALDSDLVTFNGGGQSSADGDNLHLRDSGSGDGNNPLASFEFTSAAGGSVSGLFDDGTFNLNFSGTEFLDTSPTFTVDALALGFSAGNDTATFSDADAIFGEITVGRPVSGLPFTFTPPSDLLVVDTGLGDDTISLSGITNPLNAQVQIKTGPGHDLALGSLGVDRIEGAAGNDTLDGLNGNDEVFGQGGNDLLSGDAGNDTVVAQDGNDTLTGGVGSDLLNGGTGQDLISEVYSTDSAFGFDVTLTNTSIAVMMGFGSPVSTPLETDTIADLTTAVRLIGTDADDRLDARGFSGPVTLNGIDGNDQVLGGSQNDLLFGGTGNDTVIGFDGNDTVLGGLDNDNLLGGSGSDSMLGEQGNDVVQGQGGNGDRISGGAGSDTLDGGIGTDTLFEVNVGNSKLVSNKLLSGDDVDIVRNIEQASITANVNNNRIDTMAFPGPVTLNGGDGNDQLLAGPNNDVLFGAVGDDTVVGFDGDDAILGGTGNDNLLGSAGSDLMLGEQGNDVVQGQGGSGDRISGGPGADTLDGGAGTDILFEENVGNSKLVSNHFFTGDDDDFLRDLEQANISANAFNNRINASEFPGFVILSGGGGNDTLLGSLGGSLLLGDSGNDFLEVPPTSTLPSSLSGGTDNDTLIGSDLGDTLSGESGNDVLWGAGGIDFAFGGAGNDTMGGGDATDILSGNEGADGIAGEGGDDSLTGGPGTDTLAGGPGNDSVDNASEVDEAFSFDFAALSLLR